MGASPQRKASRIAMETYGRVGDEAYGKGIGTAGQVSGILGQDLQRWEAGGPEYYRRGFDAQRAALSDQLMRKERADIGAQLSEAAPAIAGGNTSAALTGTMYGQRLAQEMGQSRLMQGMGAIEQKTGTIGSLFGQAQGIGSDAMTAGSQQLQAINMMSNVNPQLALALGIANAAGAGYGAYSGWASGRQGSNWTGNITDNKRK